MYAAKVVLSLSVDIIKCWVWPWPGLYMLHHLVVFIFRCDMNLIVSEICSDTSFEKHHW